MASSSSSSQFDDPAPRRPPQQQQGKPPSPLLLAAPAAAFLIRIRPRNNSVWRDFLHFGVVAGVLAHNNYLISVLDDMDVRTEEKNPEVKSEETMKAPLNS